MILFAIVIFVSLIIDQIIKFFVENNLYGKSIDIIENIFSLTYVQNKGAAWGIFSGNDWILKIFAPILIILVIIFVYKTCKNNLEFIFGGLIVGGAIGNLLDRIIRGYVVDFLDFKFWPVFNFADICIVLGCLLLIIELWLKERNNK